jgi:hypothetical protein
MEAPFGTYANSVPLSAEEIILRPLSDLTKEIEVDGVTFLPIEKLVKISISWNDNDCNLRLNYTYRERQFNVTARWDDTNGEKDYFSDDLFLMPANYKKMKAWIVEKLVEWHFDVFGLIKSGLAIDINTLIK